MAWLESLGQGLRGAGGILDQNVYQEGLRDERLKEVEYSRRRDLIAQQIVKGMESGAIPQEQWAGAQETLGKLGYPNMPVGLSLQAQQQKQVIADKQRAVQEQAQADAYLAQLRGRFESAQRPRTTTDAADNVMQEPGMSRDDALRSVLPDMILHPNRFIAERGAGLEKSLEATEARRETVAAALQQRAIEAEKNHIARMQMLQTAEARVAETQRHNQVMEGLRAAIASAGGAGGAGSGRVEPFKYSVDGQNVQGWRDRQGNVYDSSRRPVAGNIGPEITPADQNIARKNTEESAAIDTISNQLTRLENLAQSNPRSVAGPLSGLTRAFETVASTAVPGSVNLQATQAQQEIRSIISNLPKTGRLSNYQQQEMRRLFEDGLSGNAESLQHGIRLLRENLGPRQAATQQPTGRSTPRAGAALPPPPPGFKVD